MSHNIRAVHDLRDIIDSINRVVESVMHAVDARLLLLHTVEQLHLLVGFEVIRELIDAGGYACIVHR